MSLFFWETPYAGKRSSWLVRHREVDWCLSINCKAILFIPFAWFPSVFWDWSGWECHVYYAMRKSKRFLNWSSGQDLLTVLKSTPVLPHAKMLLVPIRFFCWRVDYALECSMFWLSKCYFSRLFHTWEVITRLLIFCGFWISGLHDMPSDARAFSLTSFEAYSSFFLPNKAVRFFIFFQRASGSE